MQPISQLEGPHCFRMEGKYHHRKNLWSACLAMPETKTCHLLAAVSWWLMVKHESKIVSEEL